MIDRTYLTDLPKATRIISWCLFVLFLSFAGYYETGSYWAFIGYLPCMGFLGFVYIFFKWKYPILKDQHIEVVHLFEWFPVKTYKYKDIEKIYISTLKRNPCVIVKLKGLSCARSHSMNCMGLDSLDMFIDELRKHGVVVIRNDSKY